MSSPGKNVPAKVLLEVGAEGGSMAILGTMDPGAVRRFRFRAVDESLDKLDDGERDAVIEHESGWLDSWDAVWAALNEYPWLHLSPTVVAPEVAEAVWAKVLAHPVSDPHGNGPRQIAKWRSALTRMLGFPPDHWLVSALFVGMADAWFVKSWEDKSDTTFRPFVAAILALRDASTMHASEIGPLIHELRQDKRTRLLSRSLGKAVPERVLQWSARAAWPEFTRKDWVLYFDSALAEKPNSPLALVRTITPTLLRQWPLIPAPLRRAGLLNVVSTLELPLFRWESLSRNFESVDANLRPQLLREADQMKWRGDLWDLYFRCQGTYGRPFQLPRSLPHSPLLEPLSSPMQMDAEGLVMKNCLPNRVSRVLSGSRIYFRLLGKDLVTAELVRRPEGWEPGDIRGPENGPVPESLAAEVRSELCRMAKSITDDPANWRAVDAYLDTMRVGAQHSFSAADIDGVARQLETIHGKSLSWSEGAFLILSVPRRGYIQFMCSPDGSEFLCEIQSHKFVDSDGEYLDSDAVELIERAGFVWPVRKANFQRWFNGETAKDIRDIAEVSLAVLHRLFDCSSAAQLKAKVHIPRVEAGGQLNG